MLMMGSPPTHPDAERSWRSRVAGVVRKIFAFKPRLTISEWAEQFRWLDEFTAGGKRPWSFDYTPFLRGILDTIGDPRTHVAVVMKSAQVGYTQGVLVNVIGYFMHQAPRGMMLVQPSEGDAKAFSKKKLDPVIKATPVLRALIKDQPRKRGAADADTLLSKFFFGGFLQMVGSISPRGLRRDSVGVMAFDEVDGMDPRGAGDEGDQIALGTKRTETFFDWKVILGSTPTLTEISRIYKAFKQSDQRYWMVPCPHCQKEQALEWGDRETPYGIKFEYTKENGRRRVVPGSVFYLCRHCQREISGREKWKMVHAGRWVASNPGSEIPGWHINALISLFPGASWPKLVQQWLDAQGDPGLLQVFFNTVLGLTWDGPGEKVDPDSLLARCEAYSASVPMGVGLLTCSVDTQDRWLEYKVIGWGRGGESWVIDTGQLVGSPARPKVWEELEGIRLREWQHEGGATLRIAAMTVDSGGHFTDEVYKWVRPREEFNVRATKGSSTPGKPLLARVSRPNKRGVRLVHVGTETAKDTIYARLKIDDGPGRMHFPRGLDLEYFQQLTSETAVTKLRGGRPVRTYVPHPTRRNEALDLWVGNLVALRLLGAKLVDRLGEYVDAVQAAGLRIREAGAPPSATIARPRSGRPKKGRRELSPGVR
ncbi:MAG: terminase gpA endonuclease subunit [Gemmatimonadota bacterium]